ncbi:glycosyltransferase [Flavobacterium sp. 3HN19-14]|uniref:glycosyltransferase n=1 Tax=Flavobacterium sp. 3HN19-14 TaxID=3448133 RepID=UPI003EE14C12
MAKVRYENFLREDIKNHELESVFEFMGSRPNLHEIFCQYDYMLQPTHMECFSLSILESLAANVPVITTNVGGNEEAVTNGENGFIFKAKNVDALAEILENILNGNLKIEKEVSSFITSHFSLEQMVEKHLKLLEK